VRIWTLYLVLLIGVMAPTAFAAATPLTLCRQGRCTETAPLPFLFLLVILRLSINVK